MLRETEPFNRKETIMSVNYPDSEWKIVNGVRYRRRDIEKPKAIKAVKPKAKDEEEVKDEQDN